MFDLLPYNTFGLDVKAANGILISDIKELDAINDEKVVFVGLGSDILFVDDFEGLALINVIKTLQIQKSDHRYYVRCGGGMVLDELIASLLTYGITGLENLSGIPGTVGAAPVQNIGAYGCEIGDYIESVEVHDLDTHQNYAVSAKDCAFGYRTSFFKQPEAKRLFITYVNFSFDENFVPTLLYPGLKDEDLTDAFAVRQRVKALRDRKLPDPRFVGNAGSFFKNPVVSATKVAALREKFADLPIFVNPDGTYKLAAGYLIDKAGCREISHGQAGIWEHQALVLVNRGRAKPHEIVSLARYVAAEVKKKFDVDLYPEVRIIGRNGELKWEDL